MYVTVLKPTLLHYCTTALLHKCTSALLHCYTAKLLHYSANTIAHCRYSNGAVLVVVRVAVVFESRHNSNKKRNTKFNYTKLT